MNGQNDFYVGYSGRAPHRTAMYIRRVVFAIGLFVLGVALVLVFAQQPFADSLLNIANPAHFPESSESIRSRKQTLTAAVRRCWSHRASMAPDRTSQGWTGSMRT